MTVIISLFLTISVHAGFHLQERSDYLLVKGRYSNYDYAYSVRLPKGLTGVRPPSPFPNHGFEIQLSDQAKAIVAVDASYNAAEWRSFADAIKFHLNSFKGEVGGDVSVVAQTPTVLGGLKATRFTMKP